MSHPYSGNKASDVAKRRASKMASGGHADAKADAGMIKKAMGAHDKQLHGGKHTDLGVIGEYAKGGRTKKGKKGGTQINIAILGGDKDKSPSPDAGLPPMGPGAMPPPPPMAGPPPGAGGPPGMPPKPPGMMNRGGKVPMRGGAESGVGRLDKIKAHRKS